MKNSHLCVLSLMTALAPAQDRERAFDLRYLFAEESDIWPAAEQDPHTRLRCLMQLAAAALPAVDATAKMELFEQRRFLLVVGDPAKTGALGRTLTELSRSVTRPMRLQISLIRVAAKLATRHGLAAGIQSEVKDDDLTLGKSAVSTSIQGEQAIVLCLHFLAMEPAETRPDDRK